jgi:3-methyladenine DNA glycosylase AlkD
MNNIYQELHEILKQEPISALSQSLNQKYHGNSHHARNISVPRRRQMVKNFIVHHTTLTELEYINLLTDLYTSNSYDEKCMAGYLLEYTPKLRPLINPYQFSTWLDYLEGWAEIDSSCQSTFKSSELLDNWELWSKLLDQLSHDPNINKRRASLVLLTQPVKHSPDTRLSEKAFELIDTLSQEKEIVITKAISWLLRSLVKNHKSDVAKYLVDNQQTLPKIALRETNQVIATGRKTTHLK